MAWETHWHRHPGVRSIDQLSFGEKAADKMRNGMGSWRFVFIFFAVMGLWVFANTGLHLLGKHGAHGFDPYPYILLNLFLSMLAGIQAAALLIAAKRADQISSEIALHTVTNTDEIKALLVRNTELVAAVEALTREVHERVCLPPGTLKADG